MNEDSCRAFDNFLSNRAGIVGLSRRSRPHRARNAWKFKGGRMVTGWASALLDWLGVWLGFECPT